MNKKPKIYTTFNKLHEANACTDRYRHLAKCLGGVSEYGRNTPITIQQIIEHNGLPDALWALPTVEKTNESERIFRLFACACAERVLPIFERIVKNDTRPRDCIGAVRRFADGEIGRDELEAARAAARAASDAAARAASDAAARAAAWVASWAAVRGVWDARVASGAAEREAQSELLKKILDDNEADI